MSLRYRSIKVAASLLILMAFVSGTLADTLRLKDGSIIKGKIVSFQDGKFVVAIGDGARRREMTFFANEIQSILFDSLQQATATTNRNAAYTEPAPIPQRNVNSDTDAKPEPQAPVKTSTSSPSSNPTVKPIGWSVKVLADNTANGWTNTGWVVKKGQRVRISADGTVSLGKGRSSTPSGNSDLGDTQKLLKNVPAGALIAVIGDDNNDFIYIGGEREITASRDGALFLGINEENLDDNTGSYNVKVEVVPDSSK